jgi:DNA-binding CsgD family transcriptional regulator
MSQKNVKQYHETYLQLLHQQNFVPDELDYSILELNKPILQKLADIGNSIVTVFDMYKREHVFHSQNAGVVLGYSSELLEENSNHFIDDKVHPDDYAMLNHNCISIIKLLMNFSEDEKTNYKLINEYRILNASNQYVRVVEQQQVLELDKRGNFWLALSILDISPNQDVNSGIKSQILNYRTGKFIPLIDTKENVNTALSAREIEILKMVKYGLLSKEISDKLSISVHTVNTHRQRVLEKLEANNSMEAIITASKLGII